MITADEARKATNASPLEKALDYIEKEIKAAATECKSEIFLRGGIFTDEAAKDFTRITDVLFGAGYKYQIGWGDSRRKPETKYLRVWWDGK